MWNNMSTLRLLLQCVHTIKVYQSCSTQRTSFYRNAICSRHDIPDRIIAHLALNNNHSLTMTYLLNVRFMSVVSLGIVDILLQSTIEFTSCKYYVFTQLCIYTCYPDQSNSDALQISLQNTACNIIFVGGLCGWGHMIVRFPTITSFCS